MVTGKSALDCVTRLDRIAFSALSFVVELLLCVGFRRVRDYFVRSQTHIVTYRRSTYFVSAKTKTEIFLQHERGCCWLSPFRATVIADDDSGLQRWELEQIFHAFGRPSLILVELALDFAPRSGVNRAFVLKHGLFGKSRLVVGRLFPSLRYGSRKSQAFVRAYEKGNIYRVESQLHGAWLCKHGIERLADLEELARLLYPQRVAFLRVDWLQLRDHLLRRSFDANEILAHCKARATSLPGVLGYLKELGIRNSRRFLRPMSVNWMISVALREWAQAWHDAGRAGNAGTEQSEGGGK